MECGFTRMIGLLECLTWTVGAGVLRHCHDVLASLMQSPLTAISSLSLTFSFSPYDGVASRIASSFGFSVGNLIIVTDFTGSAPMTIRRSSPTRGNR
jgi:hypothetical protein